MDLTIMHWITQAFQSPVMTAVMRFITGWGNLGALWIGFACYFYFIKKDRRTAVFLLLAVVLTWTLNDLLIKQLVDRPRPFMTHTELPALVTQPTSSSFPSGHTATSFAAMMILFACGGHYRWLGLGSAVLIAFSRIYLHVHYPSDVLAGCLVGICVGALCVRLMKQYRLTPARDTSEK